MKFAFVTCVQLGLSCIERIYKVGGRLDLLITLHDNKATKKSGRVYLDEFSLRHNIDLLKIDHINDTEVIEKLIEKKIDWLFIIGWSQIANKKVINTPKHGTLGMHPTLLPVGRGRAAIPWAILKEFKQTGVTMFKLDEGVDTGEIVAQKVIKIDPSETATSLYNKVNIAHEDLIEEVWPLLKSNRIKLLKQDESKATMWPGRTPSDGEIFNDMTTKQVDLLVRATTKPYPGAFYINNGGKIIIWKGSILDKNEFTEHFHIQLSDGRFLPTDFEWVFHE